jgi:hypothetical protein
MHASRLQVILPRYRPLQSERKTAPVSRLVPAPPIRRTAETAYARHGQTG